MKNGINRYEKVRIDLGWKPKECLQSYKEFCQSLDIFGVVHVHVCAQHRRAGVSAAAHQKCLVIGKILYVIGDILYVRSAMQ